MTKIADPKPVDGDYLTVPEIAYLTGLKRGTIEHWRIENEHRANAKVFLAPDDYIGDAPVWRLERVIAWLDQHSKPSNVLTHNAEKWRAHKANGGFRRWSNR